MKNDKSLCKCQLFHQIRISQSPRHNRPCSNIYSKPWKSRSFKGITSIKSWKSQKLINIHFILSFIFSYFLAIKYWNVKNSDGKCWQKKWEWKEKFIAEIFYPIFFITAKVITEWMWNGIYGIMAAVIKKERNTI